MLTDGDIKRIIEVVATKDDLAKMATKEDLANMATKDDLGALEKRVNKRLGELDSNIKTVLKFAEAVETERDKNERRLRKVEAKLSIPSF